MQLGIILLTQDNFKEDKMPFKVKNSDIRAIMQSNVSIFNERKLKVKTIYWLSRFQKEIVKCFREYGDERLRLNNDYCSMDEHGKPVLQNGRFQFENDEKRNELLARLAELDAIEVEIRFDKIKIDINDVQDLISANDILLLEPFIDFENTN
jgi:hypothetical protein